MKRMLLAVAVLLAPLCAQAGQFAEVMVINGDPTLDLFVAGPVHGKLGWSAFALVNRSWAQAYAGPTFAPAKWVEVSANIGVETGGHRFAESLWMGHGRFNLLAIYEHGSGDPWHTIRADAKIAKGFFAGFHSQGFVGQGVRAGWTRKKVTVWGALLYKDGLNTIIALRVG